MSRANCIRSLRQHGATEHEAEAIVDALLSERRRLEAAGNVTPQALSAAWSQRAGDIAASLHQGTASDEAPLASLSGAGKSIGQWVHDTVSEKVGRTVRELRKIAGRGVDKDVEALLRNPDAGKLVRKQDLSLWERIFKLPYWIAKEDNDFKRLFERQSKRDEERKEATNKAIAAMPLLYDSDPKKRLNEKELPQLAAMIHKWDGKEIPELKGIEKFRVKGKNANGRNLYEMNPDYQDAFKQWLDGQAGPQRVKDAFLQVREALDDAFILAYERMADMREIADNDLDMYRTQFGRIHNYFPHSRKGKYYVAAIDANGDTVYRRHFDVPFGSTIREEWAKIVAAERKNYAGAKWLNPQEVERLPDDILGAPIDTQAMEQIIKAATAKIADKQQAEQIEKLMLGSVSDILKARGWGAHGIQRQGIPGYEMDDIKGVLYEYTSGLHGWLTKMDAARDFAEGLSKIDARKTPRLWEYASTYVRDMLRNSDKIDRMAANVKNIAFAWYLGGNIKTAVVNATQNLMVGVAQNEIALGCRIPWLTFNDNIYKTNLHLCTFSPHTLTERGLHHVPGTDINAAA